MNPNVPIFKEKVFKHPNGSSFKVLEIRSSPSSSPFYIEIPFNDSLEGNRLVLNKIENGLGTNKFSFKLDIFGVGYKASKESSNLLLNLGKSEPIRVQIPEGIEVDIKKNGIEVEIKGKWLEDVSLFASQIRNLKPAHKDKYKHKGITLSRI